MSDIENIPTACAPRASRRPDVSRPRSDIKPAHASANASCIKKWPDRADGNVPAKSVIISRLRPPTLALKLLGVCCASKFVLRHARIPYCGLVKPPARRMSAVAWPCENQI